MWQAIRSIARNTFTESLRQPIFVVLLLGAQALLVLNLGIAAYTFFEDDKLLIDLGLSTMFLAGLFLAAFTASSVFSREIENQTVLTVLSKPVARAAFVLGKYLGVLAALGIACVIWALVFLLTVRQQVMSAASDPFDQPVIIFGLLALFLSVGLAVWGHYFYGWTFVSTLVAAELPLLLLAYALVLCFDKQWRLQSPAHDLDGQRFIA
jgi:ABC-type transport system involved in multi-copper enzyme maturation permease subunit